MKISTNIASLIAQRRLATTTKAIGRALERLSSGKRINRAADDPAGLAISSRLEAQERGLARVAQNINESFGALQTADGAIEVQLNIVQRMRELAIQAANGTLSNDDRSSMNLELSQLFEEYNRIVSTSEFNGTNLLDGNFGTRSLQVGANKGDTIDFSLNDLTASKIFAKTTNDGTFTSRTTFGLGGNAGGVATGDFNMDGTLDIVTAMSASNSVKVLLSNAGGGYNSATTYTVGTAPQGIDVGDLRGNGRSDIVTADYTTGTISILLGNGDGTFATRTTVSGGTGTRRVKLADVNNDGKLDLLASGDNSSLYVYLGNGNGSFQTATTYTLSAGGNYSINVGDVNGDNKVDVMVSSTSDNTVSILSGNGNGTFQSRTTFSSGGGPTGGIMGDFNNDGRLDYVTSGTTGLIQFYAGSGTGTFTATSTISTGGYLISIQSADMNGDGNLDLVTVDRTSAGTGTSAYVYFGNGNGTFTAGATLTTGTDPRYLTIADLRGRGINDIIVSDYSSSTNSVFYGNSVVQGAVADVSVATQTKAQNLIDILSDAITNLSTARAGIGAIQSRLDSALQNSLITRENIAGAKSNILDADIAQETAELVRQQILRQAQASVLMQSNLNQQIILQLLRF